MTTKEAVDKLIDALENDPVYREGWKKTFTESFENAFLDSEDGCISDIVNIAAENFLKTLTGKF